MISSTQQRRHRSQPNCSFTDSSIFSQSAIDSSIQARSAQDGDSEDKTAQDRCSGSLPRSICTTSTVERTPKANGCRQMGHEFNGRRHERSMSLPAYLTEIIMMGHGEMSKSLVAENATVAPSDESIFTSSDEDISSTDQSNDSRSIDHEVKEGSDNKSLAELALVASDPPLGSVIHTVESSSSSKKRKSSLIDLIRGEAWQEVERVCEEQPEMVQKSITMFCQGEKITAFHLHLACCCRNTPLTVIDALVTAYPLSIRMQEEKRGRLALHMACLKGSSPGIVRYLARAMPASLKVQDLEGNLPIHDASMCGTNQVLSNLLDMGSESCKIANSKQKLPLHVLCARWVENKNSSGDDAVSIEVVTRMIQSYPDAITTPDSKGRLPIHVACNMANPRLDVIQLLLQYKPETILCCDEDKNTPLQLAKRFITSDNDLGVAYLQEVFIEEKQRQKRKAAKRMARRILHFGRFGINSNSSRPDSNATAAKLFNC